jgi:hypothetical protein
MHLKSAVHGNIHGDGARRQGDGIGKGHQGNLFFELAVKANDLRIDQIHHSGMKHQIQNMKIGQNDLVQQPRNIGMARIPWRNSPRVLDSGKRRSPEKILTSAQEMRPRLM